MFFKPFWPQRVPKLICIRVLELVQPAIYWNYLTCTVKCALSSAEKGPDLNYQDSGQAGTTKDQFLEHTVQFFDTNH